MNRGKPALAAAGLAFAVIGALAYGLADPQSTWLGPAMARLPSPAGGAREVALTFDDGPSEYTAQVLDILRAHRVQATFFLCGENAKSHPELVRRIQDEGHEIGNHTYSHAYLHLTSRARIAAEIDRTQDVLEKILGRRPRLFRPPFGVRWFSLWSVLRERGMTMVLWSIRGYDGRLDSRSIARVILDQAHPGAIVLLHDGFETRPPSQIDRSPTVAALPAVIEGLRKAGYTFARISG